MPYIYLKILGNFVSFSLTSTPFLCPSDLYIYKHSSLRLLFYAFSFQIQNLSTKTDICYPRTLFMDHRIEPDLSYLSVYFSFFS